MAVAAGRGAVKAGAVKAGAIKAGAIKAGAIRAGAIRAGAIRAGAPKAGTAGAGVSGAVAARERTGRPGRPREFDIDDATRDAMEVFWLNGFHATSLPDLIEGMGLTRGSIYKAYTDKRSIYLAALDAYVDAKLDRIARKLDRADKRAAIRDTLSMLARDASSELGRKGCFVTAAAVELVARDKEVEARAGQMLGTIETLFADAIDDGRRDGAIGSALPTAVLARMLVCMVTGMSVLGKFGPSERANRKLVEVATGLLD